MILTFSTFLGQINAESTSNLSFHGVGLTIDLHFPQEAHPEDNINHNITITSQTAPIINNLTLTIYATINQTLQEIANSSLISWTLNDPITNQVNFNITKGAFGRLYCTLYAKTNQDIDYFYTTFYTTLVHTITFTELLSSYNTLLSNYENCLDDFDAKTSEFITLSNEHNTLNQQYQSKVNEFNNLLQDYRSINLTSIHLQGNLTSLQESYDSLNQDYTILQDEKTNLEEEIMNSQNIINTDRNLMIVFIIILVSLIALIIYLRNKQKEPYVVIRKETVSMKPEKK